jgi:hypothetical protein
MTDTLVWWKSKTLWLNVVSIALEVVQMLSGVSWLPAGTFTIIVNVLNMLLRLLAKPAAITPTTVKATDITSPQNKV